MIERRLVQWYAADASRVPPGPYLDRWYERGDGWA